MQPAEMENHMKLFIKVSLMLLITMTVFTASTFSSQYRIPVLLYHHILEDEDNIHFRNNSTIEPETFEQQMTYLYEQGYETITTDELRDFLLNGKAISGKKVLITFDDGYLSNRVYAYDILKKYDYTAIIFVLTSKVQADPVPFNPAGLDYLSIEDMERTKDVFEFGSHTHNMHERTPSGVSPITSWQYSRAKRDIEISYMYPDVKRYFAYPFGLYNSNSIRMLRELDTELAFTSNRGYVTRSSDRYRLNRMSVSRNTSFDFYEH
jgi:peptidoglycan/xylan/chitin deacetylase (PgdA/CDA1 family)